MGEQEAPGVWLAATALALGSGGYLALRLARISGGARRVVGLGHGATLRTNTDQAADPGPSAVPPENAKPRD